MGTKTGRREFLRNAVLGGLSVAVADKAIRTGAIAPAEAQSETDPFLPNSGFGYAQTVQLYDVRFDPKDVRYGSRARIAVRIRKLGDGLYGDLVSAPLKVNEVWQPYVAFGYDRASNKELKAMVTVAVSPV